MKKFYQKIFTPIGGMILVANDSSIVEVLHATQIHPSLQKSSVTKLSTKHPILQQAATQLSEYFIGDRTTFTVPCLPVIGTDFQRAVWQTLTTIPFGETRTYGQIASAIDNPKSVRAVGGANGKNPLSIFVPCHRVIGHDGTLTGYAGGLEAKEWLLRHEGSLQVKETTCNRQLSFESDFVTDNLSPDKTGKTKEKKDVLRRKN